MTSPLDTSITFDVTGSGSYPAEGEGLCPVNLACIVGDAVWSVAFDTGCESCHAIDVAMST